MGYTPTKDDFIDINISEKGYVPTADDFEEPLKKSPGFMSYAREPGIALGQLGEGLLKNYLKATSMLMPKSPLKDIDFDKLDLNVRKNLGGLPEEERNIGHKLAGALPEIAASVAAPVSRVPAAGGFLAKQAAPLLKNILTQGGISAAFNPDSPLESGATAAGVSAPFFTASQMIESQSPTLKMLGKLLRAGGAGYLGHKAGEAAGGETGGLAAGTVAALLASKGGSRAALREAAKDIQKAAQTPEASQLVKYANDIGFKYLTPAEASGNQALAAQQGKVARDLEGSKTLYSQGQQRLESEKEAFNNLLDVIYNPAKFNNLKTEKYQEAFKQRLPEDKIAKWSDNEVIKQAMTKTERQPIYKERLKNVPKDSVEYWDNIREILHNIERSQPAGSPIANRYNKLRNEIVGEIDTLVPPYQEGRSLAELEHTKDDLINAFDDAKIRGTEISKFLLKDKKYDNLMMHLRNNPEAQQLVEKWREVTKNLINPVTPKTAAGYATTGMYESRNSKDAINLITDKLTAYFKGKPDSVALAELLTNPHWSEEIDKILELTRNEKLAAQAFNRAGAIAGQSAATISKED